MNEIVIREMLNTDIPDILKIEQISFTSPWSEIAFQNELNNPYSFTRVAVSDEHVIGYICVNFILNEGHIMNLAVHPDYRRRRIATRLMKTALRELKNKDCMFYYLEVRSSDIEAVRFYERFGFKIVGKRKNYYRSPKEDAALMMLRI